MKRLPLGRPAVRVRFAEIAYNLLVLCGIKQYHYFVLHLSGFTEKSTEAYNTTAEGLRKIDVKQQQMEIRLTAAPENKCFPQSPL